MVGRASIGYPWIFNEIKYYLATGQTLAPPTLTERVEVCRRHLDFSVRWKGEITGIFEMRRHYTNYFRGLDHFKPYRMRLVQSMSFDELNGILNEISEVFEDVEAFAV